MNYWKSTLQQHKIHIVKYVKSLAQAAFEYPEIASVFSGMEGWPIGQIQFILMNYRIPKDQRLREEIDKLHKSVQKFGFRTGGITKGHRLFHILSAVENTETDLPYRYMHCKIEMSRGNTIISLSKREIFPETGEEIQDNNVFPIMRNIAKAIEYHKFCESGGAFVTDLSRDAIVQAIRKLPIVIKKLLG